MALPRLGATCSASSWAMMMTSAALHYALLQSRLTVAPSLQTTTHGSTICIWDSTNHSKDCEQHGLETVRKIELEKSYRGIGALAFSPDGQLLVAVALDNVHSVIVFDWRINQALSEGRGFAGQPPQVCQLICFGARKVVCCALAANACTATTQRFAGVWCDMESSHQGSCKLYVPDLGQEALQDLVSDGCNIRRGIHAWVNTIEFAAVDCKAALVWPI
jgi:WD40 repeat protein